MSGLSLWLKILLGAALLLAASAAAGWLWVAEWREDPGSIHATGTFELAPGEPFRAFAAKLHRAGVIEHPRLWTWLARLDGSATQVKAGEYAVRADDTPDTLLARLLAGDVVTYRLQIIEGWTVMQALSALAADPVLRHDLANVQPVDLLPALGLGAGPPEGRFFPDTYRFERGDSDVDLLRRAHARMEAVLGAAWASRAEGLPYDTPDEALIVASLVEKETGNEEDRERIARVFVNRLAAGMRLQTDPTVIYGLGTRFDGNLTREHLVEDTPYNTYVHAGLPPSPIALPGARSIAAALHPAPGDYLYFVSRGDGTSHFSVTLEEHNLAVRRYQIP
jgi:UPF0755 protein